MARKRIVLFTQQLKVVIREADMSQYRLAKESGVAKETISRFLRGQVGLSLSSIDAICQVLRLRLVRDDEAEKER